MPKLPIKKKKPAEEIPAEDGVEKITLKNQGPVREGDEQMEARWKKVESVINAAKEAYQSGKSNFSEVLESLIATLQDMLDSEVGGRDLGGLTMSGPEMNLPPEPAPEEGQQ